MLEVKDLQTHFKTGRGMVRAVDGVTFTLERGKALGVVGESGSGKTVLARTIMGLLPRQNVHTAGSVRFGDLELLGRSAREMRPLWGTEMAMVFQDPMSSLNPLMRIGKQITEPLRFHMGMGKSDALATAERLLRDVRIPEPARRLRQYPHELSGGMRQRDDRHRPRLWAQHVVRRRADDGARRHGAGTDPRPHRRAAPGPQHGGDPRHPRPRRRRQLHRRDRRDVRRSARREGADEDAVRRHEDAVHESVAAQHSRSSTCRRTPAWRPFPAARPTSSTRRRVVASHHAAPTRATGARRRNHR
ncbi:MAG: ABC transporter ATP-binding protein [Ilumatobacteraceae bacterium]